MKRGGGAAVRSHDPDRLADAIIERVGKTIVLALPLGLGKANHVANALFARAAADPIDAAAHLHRADLGDAARPARAWSGVSSAPLAERLFGGYPDLAYAPALRERRLPPNVEVDEFFFQAGSRLGIASAQQSYISANYTHALRYVIERGVNVVAQLVARARRRRDPLQPELQSRPHARSARACARAGACDFLFVGQVNSELPFMPGDADIAAGRIRLAADGPPPTFRCSRRRASRSISSTMPPG